MDKKDRKNMLLSQLIGGGIIAIIIGIVNPMLGVGCVLVTIFAIGATR